MKILSKQFQGRGSQKNFLFTQIQRIDPYILYEKKDGDVIYYEVMEIKSHNGITIGGVFREPAEFLPGDNQFGLWGWCYRDKEKATQKFTQLLNDFKNK